MVACRALVRFMPANLNTEDVVINSWAFDLESATEPNANLVTNHLSAFYTACGASLSNKMSWSGGEVRWYRQADPPPRVPFATTNLLGPGGAVGGSLPRELAICVSFQGLPVSGVPQRRRRGRIYLGPLNIFALDQTTTGVAEAHRTAIAQAANTLLEGSQFDASWTWGVISSFSPQSIVVVNDGWVDDAFDVQRRRGLDAIARTTFGDPPSGFAAILPKGMRESISVTTVPAEPTGPAAQDGGESTPVS